jgi:hypothetical protein
LLTESTYELFLLDCRHNRIRSIPSSLAPALPMLQSLYLDANQLITVSPSIYSLGTLRDLSLSHNAIVSLQPGIAALASLRKLNLSHNKLKSIPLEIGTLKHLEWIEGDCNELLELPATLGECSSLKVCSFCHNQLVEVPTSIWEDNRRLEQLLLSHNLLTHVPPSLGHKPRRLLYLSLASNNLTVSPPIRLPRLLSLSLAFNPHLTLLGPLHCPQLQQCLIQALAELDHLPPTLGLCSSLEECDIRGCAKLPTDIQDLSLNDLLNHCRQQLPPMAMPSQCYATGSGLMTALAGEETVFTLRACNAWGQPLKVGGSQWKLRFSPGGEHALLAATIIDDLNGTYSISYTPIKRGMLRIDVLCQEQVEVDEEEEEEDEEEAEEAEEAEDEAWDEKVSAAEEGQGKKPGRKKMGETSSDMDGGSRTISSLSMTTGVEPATRRGESAQSELSVTLTRTVLTPIKGSPFSVAVRAGPPHIEMCLLSGSMLYMATVRTPVTFHIQTRDKWGNLCDGSGEVFDVTISSPLRVYKGKVVALGEGKYEVSYHPTETGVHSVKIEWNGQVALPGTPLDVLVASDKVRE